MEAGTKIRQYVAAATATEIGDEDDIFALNLVDSLFALQLVLFVEKQFSIKVEREDLHLRNFSSIAAVARFVEHKQVCAEQEHGYPAQ